MATPPLICQVSVSKTLSFDRCVLSIFNGTTVTKGISLCDFSMEIDDYFSQNICIKPGKSFFLDVDFSGVGPWGEVNFIFVKVKYPSNINIDLKYIEWRYSNKIYNMSEILVLSGNPDGTPNTGWDLDPGDSSFGSPFFSDGGMVFTNPHNFPVDATFIVGINYQTSSSESSGDIPISTEDGDYIIFE